MILEYGHMQGAHARRTSVHSTSIVPRFAAGASCALAAGATTRNSSALTILRKSALGQGCMPSDPFCEPHCGSRPMAQPSAVAAANCTQAGTGVPIRSCKRTLSSAPTARSNSAGAAARSPRAALPRPAAAPARAQSLSESRNMPSNASRAAAVRTPPSTATRPPSAIAPWNAAAGMPPVAATRVWA